MAEKAHCPSYGMLTTENLGKLPEKHVPTVKKKTKTFEV